MKQIKLILVLTVLLTSCGNDEDKKISFESTQEYAEHFKELETLPLETYYNTEWECTHIWWRKNSNWEPNTMGSFRIRIEQVNGSRLFVRTFWGETEDSQKSYSVMNSFLVINTTYGLTVRLSLAKKDVIILDSPGLGGYFKYIRVE